MYEFPFRSFELRAPDREIPSPSEGALCSEAEWLVPRATALYPLMGPYRPTELQTEHLGQLGRSDSPSFCGEIGHQAQPSDCK